MAYDKVDRLNNLFHYTAMSLVMELKAVNFDKDDVENTARLVETMPLEVQRLVVKYMAQVVNETQAALEAIEMKDIN